MTETPMFVSHRARLTHALALVASACTVQRWQPVRSSALDDHSMHVGAIAPSFSTSSAPSGAWQGIPGIPAGNADAPARLKASPRKGEFAKAPYEAGSSDSIMLWISYPQARDKAPVVVVIHDNQGLSTWVRGVADQLAADGFVAVAPDLLSRVRGGASSIELAGDSVRRIISQVNFTERNKGIVAAAGYAMSLPAAERRYAIIGFCWGGSTAFNHAVHAGSAVAGAVAYYGLPYMSGAVPLGDSLAKIHAPVMLLNGANDARIGVALPAVDSAMRALGKTFSFRNYEGAAHGFLRSQDNQPAAAAANPPSSATGSANVTASKDAWPLTLAFLRENLQAR